MLSRKIRRLLSSLTVLALLTVALVCPASAASGRAEIWQERDQIYFEGDSKSDRISSEVYGYLTLTYQGSIYIPAETAARWLGKESSWNGASNTLAISGQSDPEEEYPYYLHEWEKTVDTLCLTGVEVSVIPNASVSVNDSALFLTLLERDGVLYLPIRPFFEHLGYEVTWTSAVQHNPSLLGADATQRLYIRTPLTGAQSSAVEDYLRAGYQICNDLAALMDTEWGDTPEVQVKKLQDVRTLLEQLEALPALDAPFARSYDQTLRSQLANDLVEVDAYLAEAKAAVGQSFLQIDGVSRMRAKCTDQLRGTLSFLQNVYDQIGYINDARLQ